MTDLINDYLALPEVVFMREHWLAGLVWIAACFALAWVAGRIERRR